MTFVHLLIDVNSPIKFVSQPQLFQLKFPLIQIIYWNTKCCLGCRGRLQFQMFASTLYTFTHCITRTPILNLRIPNTIAGNGLPIAFLWSLSRKIVITVIQVEMFLISNQKISGPGKATTKCQHHIEGREREWERKKWNGTCLRAGVGIPTWNGNSIFIWLDWCGVVYVHIRCSGFDPIKTGQPTQIRFMIVIVGLSDSGHNQYECKKSTLGMVAMNSKPFER